MAPIVLITVKEPKRTKTDKNDKTAEKDISTGQRFLLLAMTFLMPGMFVLCLAGSIRNAGGYVWAYNTQVFFQQFYTRKEINRFMSWIPLVGGSLGAIVGGVISDFLVKNRGTAARIWVMVVSQVREGRGRKEGGTEGGGGREGGREGRREGGKGGGREGGKKGGGGREGGREGREGGKGEGGRERGGREGRGREREGGKEGGKGEGGRERGGREGGKGEGGRKGRREGEGGRGGGGREGGRGREGVEGEGGSGGGGRALHFSFSSLQLAAAPFAAGALFLPYPWCFLSLIPSNVIGEMWIGVTSAIIIDLAPSKIRTASLALYFFIITVIGGNFNLLVPPIRKGFEQHFGDILSYRLALLFTFPALYVVGAILFLVSFYLMRVDLKRRAKVEQRYLLVNGVGEEETERREEEEEEEGGGKEKEA